ASEWINRKRKGDLLSKSVIKKVVRYGCDFVHVAHEHSASRYRGNEWRISFSIAELIIVTSWTRIQRIIFRTLRVLIKHFQSDKSQLKSYHIKTLMLWYCENKLNVTWNSVPLLQIVQDLI